MKKPSKKQFLKEMKNNINNADFLVTKEDKDKVIIVGRVKK